MKYMLAIALALNTAAAVAKPAPVDPSYLPDPMAHIRRNMELSTKPSADTPEREYFQGPADSHSGFCRFEPSMFAKVRLTQSCR
ncbi:MAG TPA: hypothetical protein VH558_10290 [Pseudolabrys sp.]|jgi:hypothetical protein